MSIAREPGATRIYTDEKPRRHAPASETGIIGWLRHNLFSTPLDIVLTLISTYLIYYITVESIAWIVRDANWFSITRNLPLFMLGPLQADPSSVTSVQILTLILAFAVGMSLKAWSHVGLRGWTGVAIVAIFCVVFPMFASGLPLPPAVTATGNAGIVSGSLTETPLKEVAFVGKEGETVSVTLALPDSASDDGISGITAFTDRATDAVINAARNRITALARLEEVNAQLENEKITDAERGVLISERGALEAAVATSPSERYAVNTAPVTVRVLAADLETVLAEGVLTSHDDQIEVVLPATGWYVLEKTIEDGDNISLIEMHGIYPHLERQTNQPMRNADGELILGVNGLPRQETITQYQRMIDDTMIQSNPPKHGANDVRRYVIIDNQFRGDRTLDQFFVLHLGPFVERLSRALLPCLLAVFLGYYFAILLNKVGVPLRAALSNVASKLNPLSESIDHSLYAFTNRPEGQRITFGGALQSLIGSFLTLLASFWLTLVVFIVMLLVLRNSASDTLFYLVAAAFFTFMIIMSINLLKPLAGTLWSVRVVNWAWFVMPLVIFALVAGTDLGKWGGLFLTFMLTIVGIVASFPIGILLALGRRADGLPVIKYLCIAFIEIVRGVPLITVLFLASLALPLVSPALSTVPQAVRAMVAITFFSAAYLAENVRGGLQSIPPGQAEAARALGMNPVQVTLFITLPQALRAVIPALVGQCIALFKDTSLVAIVGLLDLTKSADSVVAQAEYIGLRREAYLFISIVYFVFSYAMAYVSRKLEQSGSGSTRQVKL